MEKTLKTFTNENVYCHAAVGPPLQVVPWLSSEIFVAVDGLLGPIMTAIDGSLLLQVVSLAFFNPLQFLE